MSHHGNTPFDDMPEEFRKFLREGDDKPEFVKRRNVMRELLDTTGFRGAIGSHPAGKLSAHDEGAIQFAIGEKDGKVIIDFGTPVHWLGMSAQEAADFASALLAKARKVGRKQGETVTMKIGA